MKMNARATKCQAREREVKKTSKRYTQTINVIVLSCLVAVQQYLYELYQFPSR